MPEDLPIVPASVPADTAVDATLVRALVDHRFPGRLDANVPILPFTSGWDNALFAIGSDPPKLLARMPRRALGAAALRREAQVLPRVAGALPLSTPWPAEHCEPALGYPYPWALTPFHSGRPAGAADLDPACCADQLFALLEALHQPAPDGPSDGSRATGLGPREAKTRAQLALLDPPDRRALGDLFDRALHADAHAGPPLWTHSDLHPFNLLADHGRLVAVLDWGDAYAGDPAPDLAAPWMLLEPNHHGPFRALHGEMAWWRGIGWAVVYAVTLTRAVSEGATGFRSVAESTVRRLAAHVPD